MNFSNILFRCSSIGYLMTEPRAKADKDAGNLSESAKTHCVDVFVSEKYGRNTDINNKYIEKGLMVEEDSITLYSRLKKKFFKKNDRSLTNSYLKGTPDLYIGLDITEAEEIIDVKSSWDLFTFSRVRTKEVNDLYYHQLQAYMALTGAKRATLAYCLINTPEVLISDEKRKLMWKMGCATEENELYQQACDELDRSMKFDDIPLHERMIEFSFERDNEVIAAMYKKVEKARQFMNELNSSVMLASFDRDVNATIISPASLLQKI
jgi:hypothetical protein